jgi:hypothetical protein
MIREYLQVEIAVNEFQVAAIRRELGNLAHEMPKILRTAAGKTVRDANTAAARVVANHITAPKPIIRKYLRVIQPRQVGKDVVGALRVSSRGIPLIAFGPTDTAAGRRGKGGQGVIVEQFKGTKTRFPHSFIGTQKKGKMVKAKGKDKRILLAAAGLPADSTGDIYQRMRWTYVYHREGKKRYPLRIDRGLSLADVYGKVPAAHQATVDTIRAKLPKYIRSQTDWILSQYKRPSASAAA